MSSWWAKLFGSAASSTGGMSSAAQTQRNYLNTIFNDLVVSNTNEIDITTLANPRLCQDYVFLLSGLYNDLIKAREQKKQKALIMDSTATPDSFELAYFFRKQSEHPSEANICKEMAIFYLQLICLMYTVVLSTGTQYLPPPTLDRRRPVAVTRKRQLGGGTRRFRQRGGARLQDLQQFLDITYPDAERIVAKPEDYKQLFPKEPVSDIPKEFVLYQRETSSRLLDFFVYMDKMRSTPIQFYLKVVGEGQRSFDFEVYRCPAPRNYDTNYPILKANGRIANGQFTFESDPRQMDVLFGIREDEYNMDTLVQMMIIAAKAKLPTLAANRRAIIGQGRLQDVSVIPLSSTVTSGSGMGSGSAVGGVQSTQFSTMATDLRTKMSSQQPSLYQMRKRMLTPAGDRIQVMNLKSDFLKQVMDMMARGTSYFRGTPVITPRIRPLLEQWELARKANETRYNQISGRVPPLSSQQLARLAEYSKKLDELRDAYTVKVGEIITKQVMVYKGGKFLLSDDFFNPKPNRASSVHKLDLVVENVADLTLQHYIALEQVMKEAIDNVLIYGGGAGLV
jgi:hypothetical protein